MATLEQRFEWLKQILNDHDGHYSGYFKSEIADYFNLDEIDAEDLEEILDNKFAIFQTCKSFEDVDEFVSRIVGYVQMHIQTEDIIADYLTVKSSLPINIRH